MTPTIQQCRQHYEGLSPDIKSRKTAQCLMAAIQVAEKFEKQVLNCVVALEAVNSRKTIGDELESRKLVSNVLASFTKP